MNQKSDYDSGVYYTKGDYASLFKRIISAGTDLLVLIILAVLISFPWSMTFSPPDYDILSEYGWIALAFYGPGYFWFCTLIAYLYLAVLKRSSLRTFGYRAAKLKIVNMKGECPSLLQMTWRFLLLIFGPFHIFVDLFWLGGDDDRQALRDKMAKRYVVGVDASPAGSGQYLYANYNFFGFTFLFREVKRIEKSQK